MKTRVVIAAGVMGLLLGGATGCTGGTITTGGDAGSDSSPCGTIECPPGTECIAGQCVPGDPCRDVVCSNPGEVCSAGECVSGERDADGDGFQARVDCDDTDPETYPGTTRICVNDCGEGLVECLDRGEWSDCSFETDPCDRPHTSASCVDGRCLISECETGWSDCDGQGSTGCEAQLGTESHCSGCGDACPAGESCVDGTCTCVPDCSGAACGDDNGCGGRCNGSCPAGYECRDGECRCVPSCAGVACGGSDGCGGTCMTGSCPPGHECRSGICECTPSCSGAECGDSDGCGGRCDGWCPTNEDCRSGSCVCPGPNYQIFEGDCVPSCGWLLGILGLYDDRGGCCSAGCASGIYQAAGPGQTWDCNYCCEGNLSGSSCR